MTTGSVNFDAATPVAYYSSVSARCWCGCTINRLVNDTWTHLTGRGSEIYCRTK